MTSTVTPSSVVAVVSSGTTAATISAKKFSNATKRSDDNSVATVRTTALKTSRCSPPMTNSCNMASNRNKPPSEEIGKFLKYIDENILGKHNAFLGPFGRRKVVYCDYASCGRSLQFIEDYIQREVLPNYGNSDSSCNTTSLQSSHFRSEAREIVKNAVNGTDEDAIVFTGHGCSDALRKLIHVLDLREAPIVFTGATEHQDGIYQWQQIGATIVRISDTPEGLLNMKELEYQLRMHQNCGRQLIGCFSVASSVTGVIIDDIICTVLLHQYNALAFWDYNVAAPSTPIDMNPVAGGDAHKDAIYFACHKFIGGVQTPGILIAKRKYFRRMNSCGGDTDGFFTTKDNNKDFEMLQEGRCVPVVESIRAGLVVQLKETVTVANILQRQEKINKQMLQHIRTIPEIILLGNSSPSLKRLPIYSFVVRHPRGTFLHHNFICAVLNDVFGIQARAGCPCAGAYAQELLGIDASLAQQYENLFLEDRRLSSLKLGVTNSTLELLRPGFTRISLPYYLTDGELAFIMEAVKMVATEGWKLLPQYEVVVESGEWRHHTNTLQKERHWLASVRYMPDGKFLNTTTEQRRSLTGGVGGGGGVGVLPQNYSECLQTARNLFNRSRKIINRDTSLTFSVNFDVRTEKLRWFMVPHEAQSILTTNAQCVKQKVPFVPNCTNSPQQHTYNNEQPIKWLYVSNQLSRDRCLSLSAPLLTAKPLVGRQRNFSSSSQTDILDDSSSSAIFHRADIQTYVTEMTRELATNIKSEIREVINRVEDVLEGASDITRTSTPPPPPPLPANQCRQCCSSEDGRSDSISANDVAEYIGKVSIQMANEVKSEIRDVVSAVDVFITPTDGAQTYSKSRTASTSTADSAVRKAARFKRNKSASTGHYTPGSSSETVIHLINTTSNSSDEENVIPLEDQRHFKSKIQQSTGASVSSQDSGINLSFQEQDYDFIAKSRSNSESLLLNRCYENNNEMNNNTKCGFVSSSAPSSGGNDISSTWSMCPKTVWQPTVEALQEFDMIKDGDKVMVCLSGGKDSLSLLHVLMQYQNFVLSRGTLFSLGAVTVDPDTSGCDPCTLITHLKTLGVHYIIDDKKSDPDDQTDQRVEAKENLYSFGTTRIRHRLYSAAKSSGYNVLAIGQHLDDLCENFLISAFHTGKLRTIRAHYYIKEHQMRVIRPFVYVRDKYLRQFVSTHSLPITSEIPNGTPTTPSTVKFITKERQRIKQVLTQQEILFPKLFTSLRAALHPLIGFEIKECAVGGKYRRRLFGTTDTDNETDEEPFSSLA